MEVFENEPVLNADHPLLNMDNVVCTPHRGYVDRDTYEKYNGAAVDAILAFAEGNPINVLNPEVLKKWAGDGFVKAWFAIATETSVRRRALKVAFVVGSILAVINHGDVVLSGQATATVWIKIVLTFLVPYCVATFASVQAIRQQQTN